QGGRHGDGVLVRPAANAEGEAGAAPLGDRRVHGRGTGRGLRRRRQHVAQPVRGPRHHRPHVRRVRRSERRAYGRGGGECGGSPHLGGGGVERGWGAGWRGCVGPDQVGAAVGGGGASRVGGGGQEGPVEGGRRTGQVVHRPVPQLRMFSVLAGVLLLVNIFVMLAQERKTELGMLQAIGLRRNRLVGSF